MLRSASFKVGLQTFIGTMGKFQQPSRALAGFYDKQTFYYDDVELFVREKTNHSKRDQNSVSRCHHWTSRKQAYVVSGDYWNTVTGVRHRPASICKALMKSTDRPTSNTPGHTITVHRHQQRSFHTSVATRSENTDGTAETTVKKLSQKERLKIHFKEHGSTGAVLYGGLWVMSLGVCYLAVQSGIDVVALLNKCGFSEKVLESKLATEATTFAIAYGAHTLIAPVRIGLTITGTPLIVRFLRNKGYMKKP